MTSQTTYRLPVDPGYPTALRQALAGQAMPITVRGALAADEPAVAIVGARRASAQGMELAFALGRDLAAAGRTIVSGGAYGVDAAAHRGALVAGGKTVVVLGTGIDVVYPERHAELFAAIVERGGALVSMFPDSATARPGCFVARNAIIAGLCQAVVVVEAELRSGSLSTARLGQKQGRAVCAVPGSPGAAWLIGQGATAVRGAGEVLAALAGALPATPPPGLSEVCARVLGAVPATGGLDEEAIAAALQLPARAVLRALTNLELLGLVVATPGRRYLRTASPSAQLARGSCGQYPN